MTKLASILLPVLAITALVLATPGVAAAGSSAPAGSPAAPTGWQTLMTEGFEDRWPATGWTAGDYSSDGYQRYWSRDDFKPHAGVFSAWPASGGANAVDPATNVYPDNMSTQLVYGPFDLSDAADAEIAFWLWMEIEPFAEDFFIFYASHDGVIFQELQPWDASLYTWEEIPLSLASYMGDNSVWVRWDFLSDASVGYQGPFLDDITISKLPLAAPVVSIKLSGSNVVLEWPAVADATGYEVWWSTSAPYFTPGTTCTGSCATVAAPDHSFVHFGAGGGAGTNYTYVVRATKGAGKSPASGRVGEFDFALVR